MTEKSGGRMRGALPYAGAAAAGLLLAYLVVALWVFPSADGAAESPVPNVVGSVYEDAAKALESAGFVAVQGETREAAGATPNTVLEQDPAAGTSLAVGSKVTLHTARAAH